VGDPGSPAAAQAALAGISPDIPVIFADELHLHLMDLMQQEVLGAADDLILPTALVVDASGRVAAMHRGGVDVNRLAEDLRRPADQPFPYAGRSLYPQRRNYSFLAEELRKRGQIEVSQTYRELMQRLQDSNR
jgi:hypothetical protein